MLRIVRENLSSSAARGGIAIDPDALCKNGGAVKHCIQINALSDLYVPLRGRLTIAEKARANVERHVHLLLGTERLNGQMILHSIKPGNGSAEQGNFCARERRKIKQRVVLPQIGSPGNRLWHFRGIRYWRGVALRIKQARQHQQR